MANSLDQTIAQLVGLNLDIELDQQITHVNTIQLERALRTKYEELIGSFHTFLPILKAQIDLAASYGETLKLSNFVLGRCHYYLDAGVVEHTAFRKEKIAVRKKRWWRRKASLVEVERNIAVHVKDYIVDLHYTKTFVFSEESGLFTSAFMLLNGKSQKYDLIQPDEFIERVIYEHKRRLKGDYNDDTYIYAHQAFLHLPELVIEATKRLQAKICSSNQYALQATEEISNVEVPDLEVIRERLRG